VSLTIAWLRRYSRAGPVTSSRCVCAGFVIRQTVIGGAREHDNFGFIDTDEFQIKIENFVLI
jgi:hypothetical protein